MLGLLKSWILFILNGIKRMLGCCFGRRFRRLLRLSSSSEDQTTVSSFDAPSAMERSNNHVAVNLGNDEQSWNEWSDFGDTTASGGFDSNSRSHVSHHQQQQRWPQHPYRNTQKSGQPPEDEAENVNFFLDMEPSGIRQAKVFVGPKSTSNRLSASDSYEEYSPVGDQVANYLYFNLLIKI